VAIEHFRPSTKSVNAVLDTAIYIVIQNFKINNSVDFQYLKMNFPLIIETTLYRYSRIFLFDLAKV